MEPERFLSCSVNARRAQSKADQVLLPRELHAGEAAPAARGAGGDGAARGGAGVRGAGERGASEGQAGQNADQAVPEERPRCGAAWKISFSI